MMMKSVAAAVMLLVATGAAFADGVPIRGEEARALLAGKTAVGDWDGDAYRQFFDDTGATVYQTQKAPSSYGQWRINPDNGAFETKWDWPTWTEYGIERDENGYFWVQLSSGKRYAFTVEQGRKLRFH